jgi:DNA-binding CsgD family transcriptional regulator
MVQRSAATCAAPAPAELLRAAIAQSSIAIAVCDHDFTVRFFNEAIGRLIDRADDTGSPSPGVLHGYTVLRSLGVGDVAAAMTTVTVNGGWQGVTEPHAMHVAIEPFGDAGSAAGWLITAREQNVQTPAAPLPESELIALSLRLTPREREVMLALQQGASNKAIAQQLGISPRTVEYHRARIMNRFDARSLVDLVRKVAEDARAALTNRGA